MVVVVVKLNSTSSRDYYRYLRYSSTTDDEIGEPRTQLLAWRPP